MSRFKLTLEYAGTRYSGWQKQKNARTVQGELEERHRRARSATTTSSARERAGPMRACMR